MKNFSFLFLFLISFLAFAQVQVRGYYRKDGTYVRPHVRTAPNSTVTDNYSYQGNYNSNLEYNSPLPKTTNNYNSNSSTNSNSGKEWVNAYYRKDGTYVSGYYRTKRNSSSNYNGNSSPNSYNYPSANSTSLYDNSYDNIPTKKYVNTTKVNFRTTPNISDNIVGELEYNDEVISVSKVGYWDRIKIKRYNSETHNSVTFEGYINSRYLSTYPYSNTHNYDLETVNADTKSKNYKVISNKAYFHSTPDIKNRKAAYLVYGENIFGIAESKYFVYTEFINLSGTKTIGWILKDDLLLFEASL